MSEKPRILLVDDDLNFLRVIEICLTKTERFTIESTTSADDALERIQRNKPDLIVMDLRMPGKSGFWLYHQLKADENLEDIPVVVLSGMIQKEENQILPERDEAKGIVALWKPVAPNVLVATIIAELYRSGNNSAA